MNVSTPQRLLSLVDAISPAATAPIEQLFAAARHNYGAPPVKIESYAHWVSLLGRFYSYVCMATHGAVPPEFEACERAKEIIAQACERSGLTLGSAYEDALLGTNGGLYLQIDRITSVLKAAAVNRYIDSVLDGFISPTDWQAKKEVTQEALAYFSPSLRAANAEPLSAARFANDYKRLVALVRDFKFKTNNQTASL